MAESKLIDSEGEEEEEKTDMRSVNYYRPGNTAAGLGLKDIKLEEIVGSDNETENHALISVKKDKPKNLNH